MPAAPGGVTVLDMDPENREVTQEEIEEYAEFLGIDLDTERHLLWIARQGVAEPPPAPWKACTQNHEDVFYFNFDSGDSTWDHPCDAKYRALVAEERAKAVPGLQPPGAAGAPRGAAACDEEAEEVGTGPDLERIQRVAKAVRAADAAAKGKAAAGAARQADEPLEGSCSASASRESVDRSTEAPRAAEGLPGAAGDAAAGGAALAPGLRAEDSAAALGGRAGSEEAPSGKPSGGAPAGAEQPPRGAAREQGPGEEAPDDRWQALQAEVASLARSLAALKDVRGMQQEYLQLLRAGC